MKDLQNCFVLFVPDHEYANAYTDLTDSIDKLERFEVQVKEPEMGNDEANDIDYNFIEALEYGMSPDGISHKEMFYW